MLGDSFEFRGVNFREQFNIRVVKVDYLLPAKRRRKREIPRRHGQYDHGAMNWEDRIIRIECDLLNPLMRAEVREISALLSKKGRLVLWDEPDKFYIGEVYAPPEIYEFPKANIRTFKLEFECEPFAYREAKSLAVASGNNAISYDGTEEAPIRITLKNIGSTTINNITITATKRR